jgi:malonyl CoA-acyl carrier protein transacylase
VPPGPSNIRDALLFPGQGSQTAGMRELVAVQRPDLLEAALELVGADPFEHVEEGTRFAQPALYCASIAARQRAGNPAAAFHAGHSLGELAALAAAGVLDVVDGLRLAARRGALMQEAAERGPRGGMLALLGDEERARSLAEDDGGVSLANDNAPGQLVLSGPVERIAALGAAAADAGLRTIRLPVAGAFHSPAMATAADPFAAELERVELSEPGATVFCCTSAAPFQDVRAQLAAALTSPVRWRETLLALREAGAERFLETGPGPVLPGLVRRTVEGAEATTLERAALAGA